MVAAVGWYRLPSGQLYYGSPRSGAVACRVPSVYLQQEQVEPVESDPAVGPEVPVRDLTADPGDVVDAPVEDGRPAGDEQLERGLSAAEVADAFAEGETITVQKEKPKRPRRPPQKGDG